jgi:hypothetical protein
MHSTRGGYERHLQSRAARDPDEFAFAAARGADTWFTDDSAVATPCTRRTSARRTDST